jgi:hypothetical protein
MFLLAYYHLNGNTKKELQNNSYFNLIFNKTAPLVSTRKQGLPQQPALLK